jgi:hypothetical protein
MAIDKRIVAREWLVLFFSLVAGFVLTPLLFFHPYTVLDYEPLDHPIFDFRGIRKVTDTTLRAKLDSLEAETTEEANSRMLSEAMASFRTKHSEYKDLDDKSLAEKIIPKYRAGRKYDDILDAPIPLVPEGFYVKRQVSFVGNFVHHLFSWQYFLETWASILLVYVIVQILRSLFWAYRAVRGK